jgi:hypothetical protein
MAQLASLSGIDTIIESDAAALRFAEKFDSISRELRDSLFRERALLDECRRLCENSMAQTRGLEMGMVHAQLDATELDELRARIVDAERVADEARSKERNAKELVHKKMEEIQTWKDLLKEATEQASKLRNVITAQAAKEKPKIPIKKLGNQATPFEDWKQATGRVTLSSNSDPSKHALTPAQLRKLGHVPQDELDRMRENIRSTVKVVVGGPSAATHQQIQESSLSSPIASPLRLAAGKALASATTTGFAADTALPTGPTPPAGGSTGTSNTSVPRFLEIEPHPLFPAHLYLSPQSKRPEHQETPLGVDIMTGKQTAPSPVATNKDGLGGLLADFWNVDEEKKGGNANPSTADTMTLLEDRNKLLMDKEVEKSRASVMRMFAKIEAREAKIATLRAIKSSTGHHQHGLAVGGGFGGDGEGSAYEESFLDVEEGEGRGDEGENTLAAKAIAAIGPQIAPPAAFRLDSTASEVNDNPRR